MKMQPFNYNRTVKTQQRKKSETKTKVDFLFKRANILSKTLARKIIAPKVRKRQFFRQTLIQLSKNSNFLGQRWDDQLIPYHLSTPDYQKTAIVT